MLWAVEPEDHWFPFACEENSVTEFPSQKVVGPFGVITGAAGVLLTVTTTGVEAAEHVPFETVTA